MEEFMQEVRQNLEEILRDVKGCEEFLNSLRDAKFPWQILDFMDKIEGFDYKPNHTAQVSITGPVYLGKDVKIKPFSVIEGPSIISDNCLIGPHAYIRPVTIIGKNCKIGRPEIKNSIILNNSKVQHVSYVGDSLIGKNCNLGVGSQCLNVRHDKQNVKIQVEGMLYNIKRAKFGAILEDNVKIGGNVPLNPGTYIKDGSFVYLKPEIVKYKNRINHRLQNCKR